MSGLSGTGRNGVKHYYYRCNGVQKKSGCHKKLENKYLIEDEVCRAARSAFEQMDKAETAETIYQMYLQTVRNEYAPAELEKELTECTKQAENVVNAIAQREEISCFMIRSGSWKSARSSSAPPSDCLRR